MKGITDIYGQDEITLEQRKRIAGLHPETLLYLMTVSRIDRTGSITGREPLGHLTLASYLDMVGWDVRVYSGSIYEALKLLEQNKTEDIGRRVIVGLYCDYENLNAVCALAKRIREHLGYPVIAGGPQAVGLHEDFIRENPFIDAFIRGDGEYSVSDVLAAYSIGKPEARFSIHGVCGLKGTDYIDNGVSDPLTDMDEAPSLKDSLLIGNKKRSALSALSGRGCPFHCAFCYEGGNSKTVRLRSVEHMMKEIELRFAEHPDVKFIYFGDDTFTLQPERLAAFCDALSALRKKHDFIWYADGHVRVILKHPEYLKMMIDAGLRRMQIGIESTVQSIIDVYQKNIKKEELYQMLDLCLEAELPQLVGNIIIGGAMETKETIRETFDTIYDLIRRSRGMLDVSSTMYSHFPGTAMSRDPEAFGLKVLDPHGLCSFGDYPIADTVGLTRDEIAALRREFIVGTTKIMKECIASGAVDEDRMLQNVYFSRHYGMSCMWVTMGLTHSAKRFYETRSEYGVSVDESPHKEELFPTRTVFFNNQPGYMTTPPLLNDFTLSPLEDDLIHLSAGKLTLAQIIDRLWPKWSHAFSDREDFMDFAVQRMKAMEKKHILTFVDLDGRAVCPSFLYSGSTAGGQGCSKEFPAGEIPENRDQKVKKNKVILFYPYTISALSNRDFSGQTQGIFILGAVLKEKGYAPQIYECIFNQVIGHVRTENDGTILAVGMSVDYENRRLVLKLSRKITDEFGIPVILGGVDARTLTFEELSESGAFAVIKGEGEITLPEVIACIESGMEPDSITGLLMIRNGALKDTGPEQPPMDLDALPFPDYSLSRMPVSGSFFYLLTSRGCPNHCAFCHEGTHKTRLRMRAIPRVLEEIRELLKNYPQLFYLGFADDTLVTRPERVQELCEGLNEIRKTRKLEWYCEADVYSLVTHPEIIPVMVDAGLVRLQIGIESGDDKTLALFEKKLTTDMVRKAVRLCYEAGVISVVGPVLIGAPFEDRDYIELEKKWVKELIRLGPGMMEIPTSIITPYPQTRIGREPERYGYTFSDAAGDGSNTDYPAFRTPALSEREILKGYQEILETTILESRAVIDEGLVSYDRLKAITEIHMEKKRGIWGDLLSSFYPIIFTYFQLLIRCNVPPIREIKRDELAEWHVQRTFEIWRFVNTKGAAPMILDQVLSPYEYRLILFCAGKLKVREIAEKMYEQFSGGDSPEAFLDRVIDTLLAFEKRYWVVGVPY